MPAHVVGEILGGELVVTPTPPVRHGLASSAIGALVTVAFQLGQGGPGGWWILRKIELSLGVDPRFDPVVPDIAGWRRDKMPGLPDVARMDSVPDWVCEVLSPGTQRHDRVLKVPFYARAGVRHCWLVDPIAQTLEVLRLEGGQWVLAQSFGGDETVRAEPFDAIELPLKALWDRGAP
ncbi:MAG TPA: Uma2 family endonuclease [Myxococcota bacterium]|nr:Uma2 family endonuclease [Myxococcota bacterium]